MNETDNETISETAKEALRVLYPAAVPSAALRERVARMADDADRAAAARRERPRNWFPALAAAGAAVAAAAAVLTLSVPRASFAATLLRVSAGLTGAAGVHYKLTTFYNGKPTVSWENWARGADMREDSTFSGVRREDIRTNHRSITFIAGRNTAISEPDGTPSVNDTLATVTRMRRLQQQIMLAATLDKAQNLGDASLDGQRLTLAAVPARVRGDIFHQMVFPQTAAITVAGRNLIWFDAARQILVRMEEQVPRNGGWETVSRLDFDFDRPVTAAVFALPRGVRTLDAAQFSAAAGARFVRPLAVKTLGARTVAVRDVEINRDGDIVVLYTDGSTPSRQLDSWGHATAEGATPYVQTAWVGPFMYCENKHDSRGMTVGGQVLYGVCIVPVSPIRRAQFPKSVVVDFHYVDETRKTGKTLETAIRLRVSAPTRNILPSFAPDLITLGLMQGGVKEYVGRREEARRADVYNHGNKPEAMIALTDQAIAAGVADVNAYLDRADALKRLGRYAEARAALRAARAADQAGFYSGRISEAEKGMPALLSPPPPNPLPRRRERGNQRGGG